MIEALALIGIIAAVIYLSILIYLSLGIFLTNNSTNEKKHSFSIVLCAHNESKNISTCLDSILDQNYPKEKMEIIIVNDRSEDDTETILKKYEKSYNRIKIFTILDCDKKLSPKKNALTLAISKAQNEILAITDADCIVPKTWLQNGSSYFSKTTGMVIGPAPLIQTDWWLSPLMCIDALVGIIISYGSLSWGHAVTCTGRNLFYRKKVFEEVQGFSGIEHILMGDDDLFMMKVKEQTTWDIKFLSDSASAVISKSPRSLQHFFYQKRRHIAASKHFPILIKLGFGISFLSKFLIMLTTIILFIFGYKFPILNIIFIIMTYFLTLLFVIYFSLKGNNKSLFIFYPVWEIYYILNQLIIGFVAFSRKIIWGNREKI